MSNGDKDPSVPPTWRVAFSKDGMEMIEKPGRWVQEVSKKGELVSRFKSVTWTVESHRPFMELNYKLVDPTTSFVARLRPHEHNTTETGTVHVFWIDIASKVVYPAMFNAYVEATRRTSSDAGIISGVWGYEKIGPRQGIKLIEEL